MIEKMFRLHENNTTIRTECMAGLTTFLTMAYIIIVQPLVLSGQMFGMQTGMDFGSVMVATCLSAALATIIMGVYARYPIAQAPGMGENFFFVFSVLGAAGQLAAVKAGVTTAWQVALGVVFIAGVLFVLLSLLGIRAMIVNAVSPSMKNAMAVGIGFFIAFIGLQNASLVTGNSGTLVKLNPRFFSPDLLVFFFGLILTTALHVRRVRGSILWGILATTLFAVASRGLLAVAPESIRASELVATSKMMTNFELAKGVVAMPPSLAPTFFKMDIAGALTVTMIPFIIIFLFMDVFDTIGTLVGVSEQAGFIKDNKLPRARQAMLSDAVGTVTGACLGTSTVTSFIESAAGVEQGGRTGLTAVVTALFFLAALFVSPIVFMIASYPPITAPALVVVGAMMIRNVRKIDWEDYGEALPAFLTIIGIPLTYSIADGLALGFITYPLIKCLGGHGKQVSWLMYLLAALLLIYFVLIQAVV